MQSAGPTGPERLALFGLVADAWQGWLSSFQGVNRKLIGLISLLKGFLSDLKWIFGHFFGGGFARGGC